MEPVPLAASRLVVCWPRLVALAGCFFWVSVDDLLAASVRIGFPISYDELIECVETNDKKRFSFDDTGDLIRANQGHSDHLSVLGLPQLR